jgi:hypothetical protein
MYARVRVKFIVKRNYTERRAICIHYVGVLREMTWQTALLFWMLEIMHARFVKAL